MRLWQLRALGAAVLFLSIAGSAAAQQTTSAIVVQVVDSVTSAPVQGAQVHIQDTDIGGVTNSEGRIQLLRVPVGTHTVRVQMIGYASSSGTVTVTAAGPASLTLRVKQAAVALPAMIVTALGIERSERSLGFAVQNVNAVALERSPEATLVSALSGQSAG